MSVGVHNLNCKQRFMDAQEDMHMKLSSTASWRTLIRGLLLQIRHSTHFSSLNEPPPNWNQMLIIEK